LFFAPLRAMLPACAFRTEPIGSRFDSRNRPFHPELAAMKLLPLVALSLVALSTTANAQTATREDFKEFCGLLEGRWTSDVTLTFDQPPIGKKGDKVAATFNVKRDADVDALVARGTWGSATGISTFGYNAAEKKIAGLFVDSTGYYGNMTYYKKDGIWMEQSSGSLGDGKKEASTSTIKFSDKNTKMVLTGTGTVDGKSVDPRNDTYTRPAK
jgi:hypothetical protein